MTRNRTWTTALLLAVLCTGLVGCGKNKTDLKKGLLGLFPEDSAKHREARKNNLKQIGIALHGHHDVFGRFPAADSNGAPAGPGRKAGLSWRVHLLPWLEQKPLYDQFKLDEPWDSPHNKQLIPRMPEIYASPGLGLDPAVGKTCVHVFVGSNNTPFSIQVNGIYVGGQIRHIIDGTSHTIMVAEAGPDKADIWTRPGGLPFDPGSNPFDALGDIPQDGFLAAFCDSSVRLIQKSTPPEILKLLIQHNDGQRVPEF